MNIPSNYRVIKRISRHSGNSDYVIAKLRTVFSWKKFRFIKVWKRIPTDGSGEGGYWSWYYEVFQSKEDAEKGLLEYLDTYHQSYKTVITEDTRK